MNNDLDNTTKQEALKYHNKSGKPGKVSIIPTKPLSTQHDLSLAYSPGVAAPCLAIAKNPEAVYDYTEKTIMWLSFQMAPQCWDLAISVLLLQNPSWKAKLFYLSVLLTLMQLI